MKLLFRIEIKEVYYVAVYSKTACVSVVPIACSVGDTSACGIYTTTIPNTTSSSYCELISRQFDAQYPGLNVHQVLYSLLKKCVNKYFK